MIGTTKSLLRQRMNRLGRIAADLQEEAHLFHKSGQIDRADELLEAARQIGLARLQVETDLEHHVNGTEGANG